MMTNQKKINYIMTHKSLLNKIQEQFSIFSESKYFLGLSLNLRN